MSTVSRDLLRRTRAEFFQSFLVAGAVTLFVNMGMLFVPLYDMQLYDRVLQSKNMNTLTMLSVGCVAGMAIYGVLEFCRTCVFLVMGDRLARRLNIPALKAAVARSLGGDASAAAQALRDLNDLRLFVTGGSVAIPLDLLWIPALLMVLVLLHPAFGIYAACGAAILFGISLLNDLTTKQPMAEATAATARGLNELSAALRNVELLDGMGMLPAVARRWQRAQNRNLDKQSRTARRARGFTVAAKTIRLAMQGGLITLGVILIMQHKASPGAMMGANLLTAKMLLPFEQLVSGWRAWVLARAAWGRVKTLLAEAPERPAGAAATVAGERTGRLVVEDLRFVPEGSGRAVLDGVSFAVEPGEALAIIGPSGAGKSTLVRLMVGLFPPTEGRVLLGDEEVYRWEREAFGHCVGYLPQSVALLDGTIFDNISRMATDADPAEVVAAARKADVHEMIGRLPQGYSTWIGGAGFALSGGQRQRVALARALFGAPRLLILDEPNANLDHAGEQALIRTIEAAKQDGAAVVLIAHRPAILAAADRVLVLRDGRVERCGPRDEILGDAGAARPPARLATDDSPAPVPAAAAAG
ncbi:MAG TPA: type I secretion system permease/ATPase [Stellaceae bacterium]